MTGDERRITRRIRLIVGVAIIVFATLCITLTVQLSIMANQRATERSLNAAHQNLQNQLVYEQGLESFFLSFEFIEEFALRQLGLGRPGSLR